MNAKEAHDIAIAVSKSKEGVLKKIFERIRNHSSRGYFMLEIIHGAADKMHDEILVNEPLITQELNLLGYSVRDCNYRYTIEWKNV